MKLIMLGAPGAGKGTQAKLISEKLNIPAISTGAIIREAIEEGTEFGKKAKVYIDRGDLLPDEMVIGLVTERLKEDDCKNGFIFDGFPRTLNQAVTMEENGIKIDMALSLEVEDEVIVKRLSGRRECSHCRTPYHVVSHPPKKDGVCDECGAPLITREDDNPETILLRLKVYHEKTAPLKEFFEKEGILKKIPGKDTIEETTEEVMEALKSL